MRKNLHFLRCFVASDIFTLKRRDHITFLLFWLKYTSSQYVSIMAKQTPRSFFHSAKKQEMKTFSNLIEKSNIGKWCSVWYVVVVYSRIWHTTNPDKIVYLCLHLHYWLSLSTIKYINSSRTGVTNYVLNKNYDWFLYIDITKALTMFPFSHSFDEILTVQNTIYVG